MSRVATGRDRRERLLSLCQPQQALGRRRHRLERGPGAGPAPASPLRHPGRELQGRRPRRATDSAGSSCARIPRLVYCSITGFGQTGPYAPRAGYDYLAQGLGGIMSITGEPDGLPHEGRRRHRRHHVRHVRHRGDPGGPAASRRDRRGPVDRCRPARHPDRLAGQRGDQLPALRPRPTAPWQRAPQHRALQDVRERGRPCDPGRRQ